MPIKFDGSAPSKAVLTAKASVYDEHLGESKTVLKHKQAVGTVLVEKQINKKSMGASQETEVIHKALSTGPSMANISVLGGRTISTAPFEFVRIDVSLQMPCATDPKSLEETYEFITDWVGGKLKEAEKAFKGGN